MFQTKVASHQICHNLGTKLFFLPSLGEEKEGIENNYFPNTKMYGT